MRSLQMQGPFLPFIVAALALSCGDSGVTPDDGGLETATSALTVDDCLTATEGGSVSICHATGSASNPYTVLSVSTNACGNAHVSHTGDVLPDANGACCPLDARDCADVCGGSAVVDCAGVCDGASVVDCAGVCDGTAVSGSAGGCCEPSELDCAGECNGDAVEDCAGVCGGAATWADIVHFTTNAGVFRWSSAAPSSPPAMISAFPSYAIAVSPAGQIVVGTGGVEAATQGLTTAGIYSIDPGVGVTLVSATAAEDLQFAPSGDLYAANALGIYAIDETTGAATQVSANPTSQFAFESDTSAVTTNGTVYGSTFGYGTHRINLLTGSTTAINSDGGEDIKVLASGQIYLSGQGGVFAVLPSGAFSNVYNARKAFNFGFGSAGDLYLGNSATYGLLSWPVGFYAPSLSATAIATADINALVVTEGCE